MQPCLHSHSVCAQAWWWSSEKSDRSCGDGSQLVRNVREHVSLCSHLLRSPENSQPHSDLGVTISLFMQVTISLLAGMPTSIFLHTPSLSHHHMIFRLDIMLCCLLWPLHYLILLCFLFACSISYFFK